MQNLSKITIENNQWDNKQIKEIFENEGIIVLKNFFDRNKTSNISNLILDLVNNIKNGKKNESIHNNYKTVYTSKNHLSYKDKINAEMSIVETRDIKEDGGMIDIFNFDKSFNYGKILKEEFFSKSFKSKIETIFSKKIELENLNIYYNKDITLTREYHIDSYLDGRFKIFLLLTDCIDYKYGPFSYILKSHKKNIYKLYNYINNKIFNNNITNMKFYNKKNEATIVGEAGTLFISNQSGIHRGLPQSLGYERLVAVLNFKIQSN